MQHHRIPPYRPLAFILTETIGLPQQGPSSTSQSPDSISLSQYKLKDILVPQYLQSHIAHLYYLFHIAPVYNWLRDITVTNSAQQDSPSNEAIFGCFQRQVLQQYITGKFDIQPKINNNNVSYSIDQVQNSLMQASSKFPPLKQCLLQKVFILAPASNTPLPSCNHHIKTSVSTQYYRYDKTKEDIISSVYYCKDCQQQVQLEGKDKQLGYRVQQYPFAPIFNSYHGEVFNVVLSLKTKSQSSKQTGNKTIIYRLRMVFANNFVLVKAANDLWYQTDLNSSTTHIDMKIVNFHALKGILEKQASKKNRLYVYAREQMSEDCGVLKIAKSLNYSLHIDKTTKTKHTYKNQLTQNMDEEKSDQKVNKLTQNKKVAIRDRIKQQKKPLNSDQIGNMGQDHLEQLSTQKAKISLPENLSSLTRQKYMEEIQKQYPTQKQKDEYEKDYDKGKTKKIKKKIDYIKPDFNHIFKQVKQYNQELIEGKREIEKKGKKRNKDKEDGQSNFKQGEASDNKNYGKYQSGGPRGGKFGGNKFGGKKFGGRKQYKKWDKKKKQVFANKFNES